MTTIPEPSDRQPVRRDFSTDEGRLRLYYDWTRQRMDEGVITREGQYTVEERQAFLAHWLRWVIEEKYFDPHTRLPPYAQLAALPFNLEKRDIAQVIRQLRAEKILPPRKTRKDKDQPQWTKRDKYLWEYIGSMRAIRFDQARRLLARASDHEVDNGLLSLSRTSEIISRYTAKEVRYAVFKSIFHGQPGWIYLSRRGLKQVGLTFRAEAPSVRILEHLYWINEVRMQLEDEHPDMIEWISEREIQAEQEQRQKGNKLKHIPDGILVLPGKGGKKERITTEVQVSKPSHGEVEEVMSDQFWTGGENIPLRYYVNHLSRGVVRSTYKKMQKERRAMRPRIEIIDLAEWHRPTGIPPKA